MAQTCAACLATTGEGQPGNRARPLTTRDIGARCACDAKTATNWFAPQHKGLREAHPNGAAICGRTSRWAAACFIIAAILDECGGVRSRKLSKGLNSQFYHPTAFPPFDNSPGRAICSCWRIRGQAPHDSHNGAPAWAIVLSASKTKACKGRVFLLLQCMCQ